MPGEIVLFTGFEFMSKYVGLLPTMVPEVGGDKVDSGSPGLVVCTADMSLPLMVS